jgi:hypothetical protein
MFGVSRRCSFQLGYVVHYVGKHGLQTSISAVMSLRFERRGLWNFDGMRAKIRVNRWQDTDVLLVDLIENLVGVEVDWSDDGN